MPVVSTVTWQISGTVRPVSAIARLAPITAALVCSRSWQVSTISASAPPAISPAALLWYASRSAAYGMWPRVGSLVPGADRAEHEPGPAAASNSVGGLAGQPRAGLGQLRIRSAMPYSPRSARLAPNVLVSTQSAPAAGGRPRARRARRRAG